jgi:hypothetical protein
MTGVLPGRETDSTRVTVRSDSARPPDPTREETQMSDGAAKGTIRPFRIDVPQEDLDDLRRRITSMRWPEKETVEDESQGVRLKTMRERARPWAGG